MKRRHFEAFGPLCPRSRQNQQSAPLKIRRAFKEAGGVIIEGALICTKKSCQSEYPIIDGVPIIVADLRTYVSQQILPILARRDLAPETESLIGDCCGPSSAYDIGRQHLSTYAFAHYGDQDPAAAHSLDGAERGSLAALVAAGLALAGPLCAGPVIDMGCAVGGATLRLAGALKRMVLGVDLNFGMLRVGQGVLCEGQVSYPLRRSGLVYDRRTFPVYFAGADDVDFWACDVVALPFADQCFALCAALNLLDCVASPYDLLQSISRLLLPGGQAIISTPYDWSPSATPVEAWLGGHSQRCTRGGDSAALLRELLSGAHPQALTDLRLIREAPDMPWTLRLHDRSQVRYMAHLLVAGR